MQIKRQSSIFQLINHINIECLLSPRIATFIILATFGLLVLFVLMWHLTSENSFSNFGGFVGGTLGCLISIANAILLYSTLKEQKEEISRQTKHFGEDKELINKYTNIVQAQMTHEEFEIIQLHFMNDNTLFSYIIASKYY